MMSVIILHEAEKDLRSIQRYYAEHYPPANALFISELDRVFAQLAEFPESYLKCSQNIRRAPMPRIHHSVYYAISQHHVEVAAILSQRLNPKVVAKQLQLRGG